MIAIHCTLFLTIVFPEFFVMAHLECYRETETAIFATRTNLPVSDFQTWQVWSQHIETMQLGCRTKLELIWRRPLYYTLHFPSVRTIHSNTSLSSLGVIQLPLVAEQNDNCVTEHLERVTNCSSRPDVLALSPGSHLLGL